MPSLKPTNAEDRCIKTSMSTESLGTPSEHNDMRMYQHAPPMYFYGYTRVLYVVCVCDVLYKFMNDFADYIASIL